MSHRRWDRKGRARDASAESLFERALLGEERSSGKPFDPRTDRKTQQLCQQVKRVLTGGCDDAVLSDVQIDSVEPVGNSSHLFVRVILLATSEESAWETLGRLNERSARLRAVIAQSISRKRVPGLSFVVVPQEAELSNGGASE